MLKPVETDRRENDGVDGEAVRARHLPSAILEVDAGSWIYSTPGTRRLDDLTTPSECIQMISDPEHLPTITLIRRLCMEYGRFVAFVPRVLKFDLVERYDEGNRILEENRVIEGRRNLLRTLLSKMGIMEPNLEPSEMPNDWDSTTKLTGWDENCAPFFYSVLQLVNMGALNIVGRTDQGFILEPTERLFSFRGVLEEDPEENPANGETPDLDQVA
ncbi:MAG: hypothetical protein WC604_01070 [Candidatus Gracilibacteria bacterium]